MKICLFEGRSPQILLQWQFLLHLGNELFESKIPKTYSLIFRNRSSSLDMTSGAPGAKIYKRINRGKLLLSKFI